MLVPFSDACVKLPPFHQGRHQKNPGTKFEKWEAKATLISNNYGLTLHI